MSLTIRNLYDDGMSLLGFQNSDFAPQDARNHILSDITAALQLMQLAGEDFYAREELPMTLNPGVSVYVLPEAVQSILEPARLATGITLMRLGSRSEFDKFGPIFMGQNRPITPGLPLAYFVESLRDDAGPDATTIKLHVVPTPSVNLALTLNVINDPPAYTAANLCGNSPVPPVPHQYHESVLLPLVRMNVTRCPYYQARDPENTSRIQADYLRALTLLGLADPVPTEPDKISKELKAQVQPRSANQ